MITRMLGFGFWTGWLWALFLEGPLLAPTAERWQIEAGSMFLLFMLFNAVGLLYLGAKLHPRSLPDRGMLLAVSAGMMLLCPLLLALLPHLIQSRVIWLNLVLVSVSGLSASVLGGSWLEIFSRMSVGDTAAVIAGAVIIAGIGTILTASVPYFMGMSAVALMPAGSYLLLKKQLAVSYTQDDEPFSPANPYTAKLIILFALFYAAGGLMFKIVSLEQTYPYLFYLANGAYMLVCAIAGILFHFKPDTDFRLLYRPVLPLLGFGFILFVAKIQYALIPFLLLQAGFALFDMYTLLVICSLARFHAKPAAVCCFGLFLITCSIFSGNLLLTLWMQWAGHISTDLLAMAAGGLCLLAALVFADERETFAHCGRRFAEMTAPDGREEIGRLPQDADVRRNAGGIAADMGQLTEREKEVLQLLLKGRNNRFIGEMLNISGNTVKYHIRNIYEKLHVKNRQELLDVIERMNKNG